MRDLLKINKLGNSKCRQISGGAEALLPIKENIVKCISIFVKMNVQYGRQKLEIEW